MRIIITLLILTTFLLKSVISIGAGCYQLVDTIAFFQFNKDQNISVPVNLDQIIFSPCQYIFNASNNFAYGINFTNDNTSIPITNDDNPKYSLLDTSNPNGGINIMYGKSASNAILNVTLFCNTSIDTFQQQGDVIIGTFDNGGIQYNIAGQSSQACYDFAFPSIFQVLANNKDWLTIGIILIGIFLCFFGYYSDKILIFLTTFLLVFIVLIIFLALVAIKPTSPHWVSWISLVGSTAAGLLIAGFLVFKFKKTGYFLVGLLAGLLFGILMYAIILRFINVNGMLYISMVLFALLFGYLMVKQRQLVEMWVTAFIGSYLLIRSLGIYVGDYPNEFLLYQQLKASNFDFPWQTYIYFLGMLALLGIGVYVQKKQFKKDVKKEKAKKKRLGATKENHDLLIDDEEE